MNEYKRIEGQQSMSHSHNVKNGRIKKNIFLSFFAKIEMTEKVFHFHQNFILNFIASYGHEIYFAKVW